MGVVTERFGLGDESTIIVASKYGNKSETVIFQIGVYRFIEINLHTVNNKAM